MTAPAADGPTAGDLAADEQAAEDRAADRRYYRWMLGVGGGLLAVVVAVIAVVVLVANRDVHTSYRYVVPRGTTERIVNGETIALMPSTLNVHVGDKLIIENRDVADIVVGPYRVRAGETLEQTFRYKGVIVGECALQPDGVIRINIT